MTADIQEFLEHINTEENKDYPADPKPMCRRTEDGTIIRAVTANTQLRYRSSENEEWKVLAPVLYQSCMRPEEILIRSLNFTVRPDGFLEIQNKYERILLKLSDIQAELSQWNAEIHASDCLHCSNCGRCGW